MTEKQPHPDNFADLHRRAEEKARAVEAQDPGNALARGSRASAPRAAGASDRTGDAERRAPSRKAGPGGVGKILRTCSISPRLGISFELSEGRILQVNLAGAAMLGLEHSEVVQKRFGQFVAMENRPAFADFCKRVLTTDTKQTCEVKLLKDGQPVVCAGQGQRRPGPPGGRETLPCGSH